MHYTKSRFLLRLVQFTMKSIGPVNGNTSSGANANERDELTSCISRRPELNMVTQVKRKSLAVDVS